MLYFHSGAVPLKTWLRVFVICFTKKHAAAGFAACFKTKHPLACFAACFIMKRETACFAGIFNVCFQNLSPHGFYFSFKLNQNQCHKTRWRLSRSSRILESAATQFSPVPVYVCGCISDSNKMSKSTSLQIFIQHKIFSIRLFYFS